MVRRWATRLLAIGLLSGFTWPWQPTGPAALDERNGFGGHTLGEALPAGVQRGQTPYDSPLSEGMPCQPAIEFRVLDGVWADGLAGPMTVCLSYYRGRLFEILAFGSPRLAPRLIERYGRGERVSRNPDVPIEGWLVRGQHVELLRLAWEPGDASARFYFRSLPLYRQMLADCGARH